MDKVFNLEYTSPNLRSNQYLMNYNDKTINLRISCQNIKNQRLDFFIIVTLLSKMYLSVLGITMQGSNQ